LWGYQNDFTKQKKTIYDPCPQGYMVADRRVWENVATYQATNGWQEYGAKISISGSDIWYPIQGCVYADGTPSQAANSVRMWSSTVDINKSGNPYELRYNQSGNATVLASQQRNVALPVRCVSGHSTEVVRNLSAAQTANCYMVHAPGYYKFKATTRGNGVTQILTTDGKIIDIGDGMSANFSPAKVDFLWYQGDFNDNWASINSTPNESEIPMVLMDGGKPDAQGYVTFYVGEFHKGNVGLAAYDTSGNILWSWHIWFTDQPENKVTGNYTLMDRFIGATYAPTISGNRITFASDNQRLATYGFYYQWGKKDPFYGPRSVNASDGTNNATPQCSPYWTKAYNGAWTMRNTFDTAGTVRVSEAPATPRTFRKRSGNSERDAQSCWFPEEWATSRTADHMWGYGQSGNGAGQGVTKTMHDPCPPGYMVMYHHAWYYPSQNNGYVGDSSGGFSFNNGEGNFDNRGIVLAKAGFDRAWYPFVGYRNGGSGRVSNVGSNGRIATCMPYKSYNTRYYFYNNAEAYQERYFGSAGAQAVRCMKE
jgi:hypothetical protein